jgi:hypothetical protein
LIVVRAASHLLRGAGRFESWSDLVKYLGTPDGQELAPLDYVEIFPLKN